MFSTVRMPIAWFIIGLSFIGGLPACRRMFCSVAPGFVMFGCVIVSSRPPISSDSTRHSTSPHLPSDTAFANLPAGFSDKSPHPVSRLTLSQPPANSAAESSLSCSYPEPTCPSCFWHLPQSMLHLTAPPFPFSRRFSTPQSPGSAWCICFKARPGLMSG